MVDHRDANPAVVRAVEGRAAGGVRGLQKLSEITIEHLDGRMVRAVGNPTGPNDEVVQATFVCPIRSGKPNICPICFGPTPDSKEHVPARAFGGRVMTSTCTRCNNRLGSRTEASLQDWFDNVANVRLVRKADGRVVGQSRHILLLGSAPKEVIMIPDKGAPGIRFESLEGALEDYEMDYAIPSLDEVRIGMLKSAYLAAILHIGYVPPTPSATEIRAELLAAVDARTRAEIPLGDHARRLWFIRTRQVVAGPPLGLYRAPAVHEGLRHLISLAGSMLVQWPFPEIDPENFPQLSSAAAP